MISTKRIVGIFHCIMGMGNFSIHKRSQCLCPFLPIMDYFDICSPRELLGFDAELEAHTLASLAPKSQQGLERLFRHTTVRSQILCKLLSLWSIEDILK